MSEKDYTTYDATELAQEPGFISWVRADDGEAVRFWEQWAAAHPERSEVVDEARRLVLALHFAEAPPEQPKIEQLWNRIEEAIDEPAETAPARMHRLRWMGYVAAAVALLLLTLQVWNINRSWEVVRTKAGQRLTYILPDSSVVELNAATTLRYKPRRYALDRRVQLTGEAFFNVEKGASFVVTTRLGKVTVLGTSFNVSTWKDEFAVGCFTGRVAVQLPANKAQEVLTAGRGIRLNAQKDGLTSYTFNTSEAATWRQGRIYFNEEPLGTVFDRLERQFDVKVESTSGINDRTATGFFRLVHVDSALYDVTWPFNLRYQREGSTVTIREQ